MTRKNPSDTKPTSNSKYLKAQNATKVTLFIIWCFVLLFAFYSGTVSYDNLNSLFSKLSAKDSLILLLSPVLSVVLCELISSDNKARLVFWKLHNPLPGSRAFSVLAPSDARINFKALKEKIGSVPRSPKEQNTLWFSIYRQYSNKSIVEESHKYFLLSRDLAAISLLFAIFGSIALSWITHNAIIVSAYCAIMILHFLALALVAQNCGKRFVCNVLVEFVHDR